jgi:predicted dehydrogenase
MTKLRIGIVGCGSITKYRHAPEMLTMMLQKLLHFVIRI